MTSVETQMLPTSQETLALPPCHSSGETLAIGHQVGTEQICPWLFLTCTYIPFFHLLPLPPQGS